MFRRILFARVVPNLRRLGLLTPRVREAFAGIGIVEFEHADPEAQDRRSRWRRPGPQTAARIRGSGSSSRRIGSSERPRASKVVAPPSNGSARAQLA